MIAGLIQNNASTTINRFPGLGDIPIIGALFRSTEAPHWVAIDPDEVVGRVAPRVLDLVW